jgi:DNA replication initiation complex subunit (GINS family)
MLTYESLRRFVHEEKNSNSFVSLPRDFFEQARSYLQGKEEMQKEDKWELDSARRLLNDLLEIRERKILIAALYYLRAGVEPENITGEEKALFERVVGVLKDFQKTKKKVLERGKGVEFLQDVHEFVGPDMKTYGPFRKGDRADLPEEVSKVFIEKGVARIRD